MDLIDIVGFIKDTTIEKKCVQAVAKCNSIKEKTNAYNKFNSLNGVAKKNGVLQIVILCRRVRGKKIRPFFIGRISAYMWSIDYGFPNFCHQPRVISSLWIDKIR
jgi:hypothetical protein